MKTFEDLIKEVIERSDILSIVQKYADVQKSGSNYRACCPFHQEKTPSFFINVNENYYKCFGCGVGGNVINFIQKIENLTFKEALFKLAEDSSIDLKEYSISKGGEFDKFKKEKERQIKILEKATLYFQSNLSKNQEVLKYLKGRGLNQKSIEQFRIGFANDNWQDLLNYLKDEKKEDLIELGLIRKKSENSFYDYFRNRIICPIFNVKNQVIAFTCRDFSGSDQVPKYLNSPNNQVFNKSDELFGLNFASKIINQKDQVILAEGAFDLILLHQNNFQNSLISCGTSITINQLKKIKRYTENLIISFDDDNAGIKASYRCLQMALKLGFQVKILDLKKQDPADMLLNSKEEFINVLKEKDDGIIFFAKKIFQQEPDDKKQILRLEKEVFPLLLQIKNKLFLDFYLEQISKIFDFKLSSLIGQFENFGNIHSDSFSNLPSDENFREADEASEANSFQPTKEDSENRIEKTKKLIAFLIKTFEIKDYNLDFSPEVYEPVGEELANYHARYKNYSSAKVKDEIEFYKQLKANLGGYEAKRDYFKNKNSD